MRCELCLKSGMTANLDIETARSEDTIVIPIRAVDERDGKAYVDVMKMAYLSRQK